MLAAPLVRVLLLTDDPELGGRLEAVGRLACGPRFLLDVRPCHTAVAIGDTDTHDVRFVDLRRSPEHALQLLKGVVRGRSPVPAVAIAGPQNWAVERQALDLGAADCVAPDELCPSRLIRSVRRALEHAAAEEARRRAQLEIDSLLTRLQLLMSPAVERAA